MTRGGDRAGKSSAKSKASNHTSMPSIPTTVTEQGGTSSIPSSRPTGQTLLPSSTPAIQTSDMTRGGYRAGKFLGRSKAVNHANLPSIPITITQQGGATSIPSCIPTGHTILPSSMPPIQTSGQSSTPTTPETSPVTNI